MSSKNQGLEILIKAHPKAITILTSISELLYWAQSWEGNSRTILADLAIKMYELTQGQMTFLSSGDWQEKLELGAKDEDDSIEFTVSWGGRVFGFIYLKTPTIIHEEIIETALFA